MAKLILLTALAVLLQVQLGSAYKLVCYFTNWSQYRPEPAKFFPKDVDPCLCTHLIYAFATMNDNKIAPYEWNDIDVLYPGFQALKEHNKDLVTLLVVGGWNFGTQNQVKLLAVTYQEMIQAFEEEAEEAGKPRLLITAAVSAGKETTDAGYEIAEIGKLLDFISMMTYDFHGGWDPCTGHNSPLHVGSKDQGNMRYFNCICTFLSEATNAWIEDQKVPYAYKDTEWVGYDNIRNYKYKVDFLKENNFGGAMVWAIDLDDFLGSFCNEGKYPLILELQSLLGLSSGGSLLSLPHCSKDDAGQAARMATAEGQECMRQPQTSRPSHVKKGQVYRKKLFRNAFFNQRGQSKFSSYVASLEKA
ncbi:hypothetical protein E5288_WYG007031 [Bos mutus]|uniref:GH18 domain-containing protein n=1 Tax=Bos mutus TaxID=72004 RepID=A0A6B0QRD1_9CETA|nr:hypothetical protein [Bos mutus]